MAKFIYSLTYDDYISFEKFKLKRNKTAFFSYITCLLFLIMGVYDAVVYKTFQIIVIAVIMIFAVFVSTAYSVNIAPKKRVKKYISLDPAYLGQKEIIVDEKKIEIKNIPAENEGAVVAVYPYSVMTAIYETSEYYYFFAGSEVKLLPKKAVPAELSENVNKFVKNNKNYMFFK